MSKMQLLFCDLGTQPSLWL